MELHELVELEVAVWQALVDGDADTDARLLADDFIGVYPTGFAGRDDHVDQLRGGPTVEHFELTRARMLALSATALLLAYRVDYTRVGAAAPDAMYVSSLWCRREGRWLNVFSQDTPDTGLDVV